MKIVACLITIAVATSLSLAQPNEELNKELSFSATYQSYSTGMGPAKSAFLLSPRMGFYLGGNFEIEPEVLAMFAEGSEPTYMLNGNVSYNIKTDSKAWPFLLVGYGTANTTPLFNLPLSHLDFSIGVLNLGGGVKYYIKDDVALRMEYRYQKFSGESTTSYYGYTFTQKIDLKLSTVQFGFSILL